jgi:hypothetical protein
VLARGPRWKQRVKVNLRLNFVKVGTFTVPRYVYWVLQWGLLPILLGLMALVAWLD